MLTFHSRKVGGGYRKRFGVVASNCIMCRYKHVCGYVQRNAINH